MTTLGAASGSSIAPAGSILISTRAPIGYVASATVDMAFNQGCRALIPKVALDVRFFVYQLLAMADRLQMLGQGSTFLELSSDVLANFPVYVPPLEYQRRVADFLDCALKRMVSLRRRRVDLSRALRERFLATAALYTGRSMVWDLSSEAIPLRRFLIGVKTGATPPSLEEGHFVDDGIPWYGPANFLDDPELGAPTKLVRRESISAGVVPIFPAGSTLLVGIGATAGKVAYLDHPASANQQITALVPRSDVCSRFFFWQMWSAGDELRRTAPYTTLPIINNDFVKSFPVYMPGIEEQKSHARELDVEWRRMRALEDVIARLDRLLLDRWQTLITEAVTGRIDVSTARGFEV
ncbi:type I restriction enzyme S subunit [Lentzea nigeriaca]|nr:type I restriction enzyme S subunit [Lentzea nigeriaca]